MTTHFFSIDGQTLEADVLSDSISSFMIHSVPKPYSVVFDETEAPFAAVEALMASPKNLLLIDERVYQLYGQNLKVDSSRIFLASATETFKTLDGVMSVFDFLQDHAFSKGETLVVVGGGIIQDVGAFVGACFKRGISWAYFPTTLLSMCDSCIGAKTGINYRSTKNQLALFSAPSQVVISPHFLRTLDPHHVQSGLGEILKLVITGGEPFVSRYESLVSNGVVEQFTSFKSLVLSSLCVKKSVVEADEFELNLRKSLNYGHTLGHCVEPMTDFAIPHGQAVVIGMMLVNKMSLNRGLLSQSVHDRLWGLCRALLRPCDLAALATLKMSDLIGFLKQDKKVFGDTLSFVLLKNIGEMVFVKLSLDQALVDEVTQISADIIRA